MGSAYEIREYPDTGLLIKDYPGFDADVVQLEPGRNRIKVAQLAVNDLAIRSYAMSRGASTQWTYKDDVPTTTIMFFPAHEGRSARWQGHNLAPNAMAILDASQQQTFRTHGNWADLEVSIPTRTFRDLIGHLGSRHEDPRNALFYLSAQQATRTRRWLMDLLQDRELCRAAVRQSVVARHLSNIVLERMSLLLEDVFGDRDLRVESSRHHELIARALKLLQTDPAAAVSAAELSHRVQEHPRRVQRAFRAELGVSPYQYLLRARLTRARSALISNERAQSVSRISEDAGFCSPSEFSRHYTRFFGEYPSTTAHRYELEPPARDSEGSSP